MTEMDDTHCFAPPPGYMSPSLPPVVMPPGKHDADIMKDIAQENTHVALNALTEVASWGKSESARVAAANAILDRAHGKVSGDTTQVNIQMNIEKIERIIVDVAKP